MHKARNFDRRDLFSRRKLMCAVRLTQSVVATSIRHPIMKTKTHRLFRVLNFILICLSGVLFTARVDAALVGPGGYNNDFAIQPEATDWATFTVAGTANDT